MSVLIIDDDVVNSRDEGEGEIVKEGSCGVRWKVEDAEINDHNGYSPLQSTCCTCRCTPFPKPMQAVDPSSFHPSPPHVAVDEGDETMPDAR